MAKIRLKGGISLTDNQELKAPKFNFSNYDGSGRTVYHNNAEYIDFVTDNGSLYVCLVDSVTPSGSIGSNSAFLKLVDRGPEGPKGKPGEDGAAAIEPRIGANFVNDQLKVTVNDRTVAISPSLTGPTGKPVRDGNILTWELTDDRISPEDINLMDLRPVDKCPLLLRVDSDNTKRSDEFSGPARFIQWKYEGDKYWTNLISISELMNLALCGICFWYDDNDQEWHFGNKEVLKATYHSDKNGRKIISRVELGDVLFDAGSIPINDYGVDIELINQRLDALENTTPEVDAYTKAESDARFQPKGNYLTEHQSLAGLVKGVRVNNGGVNEPDGQGIVDITVGNGGQPVDTSDCVKSVTINGTTKTPVNGNVSFTISVGETYLFDVKIEGNHLGKTSDGQNGIDLGAVNTGGSGGISESDVKHLIGQILEGVLDSAIPEYVKGADHDYFIRKSGLANYTTIDDVAAMIRDAMTNQNVDYYRVFTLYQRTNNPTTAPAKPVTGVGEGTTAAEVDNIALKPNASSAGSNHPENATTSTPYLGMTSATYSYLTKSEVGQDPWETPICLTAESGEDGADGDSVEFIYILCTDAEFNNIKNTTPVAEHGDNRPDDLPVYTTPSGNGGTDHPSGISETYQIEAVSIRTKDNGTGSNYSNPTIWSMGGEDGMDGDGVEYIFAVAAENETAVDPQTGKRELNASFFTGPNPLDVLPLTDQQIAAYETAGGNYQIDDWCPDGTMKHGVQMRDLNGTDNPSDVGPDQPYEFVAIRKKKLDPVSGQMKGGPFSTPALWGFGGQKTVTVIESGNIYRHPYTCFAFTRSTTDITGYTVVNPWTYNNVTYAAGIAVDNTRKEGYYSNPLSYVVTLDDNNQVVSPANLTGSDTIPAPPGQLYMITNHIGDEASGNDQGGTSPRAGGDAAGFQVEYANSSTVTDNVYNRVTGYTLPKLDNYDLDNYPNLNDPDGDGIDEAAGRNYVENTLHLGEWGDEDDITDPDYMATCYKKQEGIGSAGQISRIKGEKGDDSNIPGPAGKDGTDIEFVYFRTDTEDHRPGMSPTYGTYNGQTKVSEDLYEDDFLPMATANGFTLADNELKIGNDFFWHDHPAGVTENLSCEWVGMRHSSYDLQGDKVGGNFNIALWSKYGANGRDGDGIEYVFGGLSEQDVQQLNSTWPTQQASNAQNNGENVQDPNDPRLDEPTHRSITDSEYLPAILINNTERQAVDNNPGIENNKYVFASMRKYTYDSVSGTSKGGEFSEIKFGNEQPASAQESIVLDIEDDTHPVYVDENGRILDRYMDYIGCSTDGMYLYKNLILLNCGNVSIKGDNGDVTIATLNNGGQSNNYDKVTIASPGIPVTSNGITAHVYPYGAGKYEDSNHSTVQLRVVFDKVSGQNPILNDSFDIIIKVQSADGQYVGSDVLRLVPKYSDKEIELSRVPGTQRTSEEGGTTYSDSQFNFYGWYGSNYTPLSLIKQTHFYFKYDDQATWTEFYIPSNNSDLADLENNVDGVQSGEDHFYFDRSGTILQNNTGAFFEIWLYNSDYNDNIHGEGTNWSAQAYVKAAAFTATNDYPIDELYFGIGFGGNGPIDEANVHIIYPGKDGAKGDKGDTVQDAYFLTAVYDEGAGNWATGFDNIRNGVSGYSGVPGELGQKWAVNIGTNIQTDTPVTLEQPTMTPVLKYLWKTSRTVTYNGNTPSYGTWSVPVLASQTGPKGDAGETVVTHQYLDGKVVRVSDGTDDRLAYSSGSTAINGVYYLDVVRYISGSTTSYYKCKSDVTYTNNKPANPASDSTHWEAYTPQSDAGFETMLAHSAYIENLTSKQVVITDGGNIVAGMASGSDIASASGNSTVGNVRIGAGTPTTNNDLTTAPFTVTDAGAVKASNINIAGGNISGTLDFGQSGTLRGMSGSILGTFDGKSLALHDTAPLNMNHAINNVDIDCVDGICSTYQAVGNSGTYSSSAKLDSGYVNTTSILDARGMYSDMYGTHYDSGVTVSATMNAHYIVRTTPLATMKAVFADDELYIRRISQSDYDSLESKPNNVLYIITDD